MEPVICYGNLLESNCEVICHQTNCQGVMGGGIALQIKNKWPEVYSEYRRHCDSVNPSSLLLGSCFLVVAVDGTIVANLFGQDGFGRDKCYTNYTALKLAFKDLVDNCKAFGYRRIGIPYGIGCGLAGGDWNKVFMMINEIFIPTYFEVEIWKLEK